MNKSLFAVLAVAAFVIAACGGGGSSSAETTLATVPPEYAGKTNPLSSDAAAAGKEIFDANCVPCHGSQGHGDGPAGQALDPKPKNLAELQKTATDDYLFWRIATGRPGTSMVAWEGILTEEQIWQVIAFLHTLQ